MTSTTSGAVDFLVRRDDLRQTKFAPTSPPARLAPGQVLLRLDQFAFTSNNVTRLMTDEAVQYDDASKDFQSHETVNHSIKEYARGEVTTNTVEGFFSIFKRGMIGTYHKYGEQHLKRYCVEFDFRYNHRASLGYTDEQRAAILLKRADGKRLHYR